MDYTKHFSCLKSETNRTNRRTTILTVVLIFISLDLVSVGKPEGVASHYNKNKKPLITFTGKIFPKRFLQVSGEPFGHHAITWKGGKAAPLALIEADIPDETVSQRLEDAGLKAGNNLARKTWDARYDPESPEPEERVEGDPVEVFITWKGLSRPKRLQDILGLPNADYRFGDHRSLIPYWKSGCIVCNVSCPGARISNRSLTIRDQVNRRLRPKLDLAHLPPDGTAVRVFIYRGENGRH